MTKKSQIANACAGFTLIELIVSFSIMAILATIGIASFSSYSHSQELDAATTEVITMITEAKSKSLSQVKPATCVSTLDGYQVTVTSNKDYRLSVMCSGAEIVIKSDKLQGNITFVNPPPVKFLFLVFNGGVTGAGAGGTGISLTGYGKTKTITIFANGTISF